MSLVVLVIYASITSLVFLRPPRNPVGPTTTRSNHGQGHDWGRQPRIRSASGADSIVFIALGPAARSMSLLYALTSLREEGCWDGAVHVIVEREDDLDCLSSYLRQSVTAVPIAPLSNDGAVGSAGSGGGDSGGSGGDRGGRPAFVDHGRNDDAQKSGCVGVSVGERKDATGMEEEEVDGGGGAEAGVAGAATVHGAFYSGVGGVTVGGNKPGGVVVNNAKMTKMHIFGFLPPDIERVVYVDCDMVTQSLLGPFLDAVALGWDDLDKKAAATVAATAVVVEAGEQGPAATMRRPTRPASRLPSHPSHLQDGYGAETSMLLAASSNGDIRAGSSGSSTTTATTTSKNLSKRPPPPPPSSSSTVMIFADAGGHTIPVCRGCDEAHSGVVALARGHSERCLELWHRAFQGDGGNHKGTATDQEALDLVLREGSGCEARWLDPRHHATHHACYFTVPTQPTTHVITPTQQSQPGTWYGRPAAHRFLQCFFFQDRRRDPHPEGLNLPHRQGAQGTGAHTDRRQPHRQRHPRFRQG